MLYVVMDYPGLARPVHEFAKTLMRGPSLFSERERELVAVYVRGLNGCDYCRDSHGSVAERLGQTEALAQRIVASIERAELLKAVLHFERQLNYEPGTG